MLITYSIDTTAAISQSHCQEIEQRRIVI